MRHGLYPAALLALLLTRAAHADEPPAEARPPVTAEAPAATHAERAPAPDPLETPPVHVERVMSWYGWQTLAADAGSLAMLAAAAAMVQNGQTGAAPDVTAALGALAYVTGAPTIHALHGRPGGAVADALLRVAAPMAGFGIGYAAASSCSSLSCSSSVTLAWMGVGVAVPILLDAAVFAEEPTHHIAAEQARGPTVGPTLAVGRTGASAGLGGTF